MKTSIIILLISFIADQLLQPKSIRQTKHKDTMMLFAHVMLWSIPMLIFTGIVMLKTGDENVLLWWASITFSHYIIEWCCIRMWTHHFYNNNKSLVVFWVLLEQMLINVSMLYLFDSII